MSNEISKCCTCGYEWRTGQDGSHTCSATLLKIINDNQSRIARLESALLKLIDVASRCDSWESFPSDDLDDAKAAAIGDNK